MQRGAGRQLGQAGGGSDAGVLDGVNLAQVLFVLELGRAAHIIMRSPKQR